MASKAVNRPTDVVFKDQDVTKKLQLYGIYAAFANGKVPSNKQVDIALNSTLESAALAAPPDKLSDEGKRLVADLRDVIEQAKLLLLSKNQGSLLQEFAWETQQMSRGDAKLPDAPVDKGTAKQHGSELLEGLRALGTLIISNGQFRKLLGDAAILIRSMVGDAATTAAGKVQPSEEQLAQIDHPAEDNTWHEVPEVSKTKLQGQVKGYIPFSKKDAKRAAAEGATTARPDDAANPADAADLAVNGQQSGTAPGVDAINGTQAAVGTLKETADQNVSPEVKSKTKLYNEKAQVYLKGKMPRERREQTIWRLKKMVVEIQGHEDYQKAIETLLRLAELYSGHSKTLASEGQGTAKDVYDITRPALTNLRTLLERFANGTSFDDFVDALNQIYRDADKDEELRGWFEKVDEYIRRCLKEQGYIMQPLAKDDFNTLYDQGRFLLREKYRSHTDRVLDEIKYIGNQFDEDPQNKAFGAAVQKLFSDLGNDEAGNPTFKPHLFKDVTEVILPKLLVGLHYVPIPRMEYSDPKVDLIVENLIVESDNLAPNVLEFSSDNYWKWGRKHAQSKNKNKVMVAVSGVQMDLRDVSFYVHKKQGFPSLRDQGLCDIFMGGEGFSFKLEMETSEKGDKNHFFTVSGIKVNVKHFNIKLKQSKHKLLFIIGKPILLRAIRPALQKALESAIKQKARELDAIIFEIHQEVQQAKRDAVTNPDPENIKNIYQMYWTAAHGRWMRAKEKAKQVDEKIEGKKFNTAMVKQDSIFPDIDLPSGISTKATEYKELAAKGERWESPVFSIGSANETTNIPSAPEIRRKHLGKPSGATNGLTNGVTNNADGFERQVDRAFDPTTA